MNMVTSHIDGRIRLRSASLRDPDIARQASLALDSKSGVRSVAANTRTGSLLVEYDPESLTSEDILQAVALPKEAERTAPAPTRRRSRAENMRVAKRGMLVSMVALLAFAAADRERAHIIAGGMFVVFNAYHVYGYRRRLLA
jgi:hypothetical protein